MKLRPTIFLSGVSSEFASFRDAVEVEIQKKGCFAENQSSFGVDYRTVEEMLRRRLNDADAVILIVGFRFGAEPKDRPAGEPRRSYTQMEYDIARKMQKPVYLFLSSDTSVRDTPASDEQPEDDETTALQVAHRQTIQDDDPLFYFFKDKVELCKLAGEIDAVAQADFRVDISRIIKYAPTDLIGREEDLKLLDDAWLKVRRAESGRPHVLTFVALGGEGKTSLVAKWAASLAYKNWPGCDSAFAWSFYSQGTREQAAASSDLFLKEAISFFGSDDDKAFAASAAGAYEKGQRLARIVSQRRSLLILDGLEPLQYAPTSPTAGELKDSGVAALLKGLAADNDGLCIVTTRYSLSDLKAFWQTTAPEVKLLSLSSEAGVHLLKTFGVKGTARELQTLVEDVKGHALTLNLLGTYLRDAHGGDIRKRDVVRLEEADVEEQGGHAFRVIEAYERALENEGDKGKRALAILRLLGLFDRPVSASCLAALLQQPAITCLTEPLVRSSEAQRNIVLKRLEDAKLLTVNRETSGALVSLDAHPLLREYFARQLRSQQYDAWRAGHQRLYEHLCATTEDKFRPTLEDLQPLYQAVAHGCQAGFQQEVCDEVYNARINRRQFYSTNILGAVGSDLGAVSCLFETPWHRVSSALTESDQGWLLNIAAMHLHGLGRLSEAIEPMRAAVETGVRQRNWKASASRSSNLSHLELTLGQVDDAIKDAARAVLYADRSGDTFQQMTKRAAHADALHQAGRRMESETRFLEAEELQAKLEPNHPSLYSLQGFQYWDLILDGSERASWRCTLAAASGDKSSPSKAVHAVLQRVSIVVQWAEDASNVSLLDRGLMNLMLGRAALCEAALTELPSLRDIDNSKLRTTLDETVDFLRRAGYQQYVPVGLLARTRLRFLLGARTGAESAREDLDEAWGIVERGPMGLHMADIHLYRARLFFREEKYPWESPEADLKAAEKLIKDCGYHRRDEELADAKRIILNQSA